MTESKQTYTEPVAGLMRLGDVRGKREWRDYLAMGLTGQHVPELCRMVLDRELFQDDSENDEVWPAVHAWRALAQLKAEEAIPTLLELMSRIDEYEEDWIGEELPVVFGYIGPAAIEPLRTFLADSGRGKWSRLAAGNSLAQIGQRYPEWRTGCVAALSRQLEQFAQQDYSFNGLLISDLIALKAVEAAPVIKQAFAADMVDTFLQGDWEEVQVHLGLLDERNTSRPDYSFLPVDQPGFDLESMFGELDVPSQPGSPRQTERKTTPKAKRKQAEKNRKEPRKRK